MTLDTLWLLVASLLVLSMQAGFLLLETGRVRAKNSVSVAQKNVSDLVVAWTSFFLIGYWLMFAEAGPVSGTGGAGSLHFLYQLGFCAAAASIVSGAVAERMRFNAYLALAALVSALIYPLVGRSVWGDPGAGPGSGWLGAIGFVDFAGATVVHCTGAAVALAAVHAVGPRFGRFGADGRALPIPGHNAVLSLLGLLILLLGWFGFNAGALAPSDPRFVPTVIGTAAAAAFGALAGMVLGAVRDRGTFNPARVATGLLGGLVAITACADAASAREAALVGLAGGLVATLGADWLLHRCRLDDPLDVVATHGMAGALGAVVVAFVGDASALPAGSRAAQALVQLGGAVTVSAFAYGAARLGLAAIARVTGLRVTPMQERLGLNQTEHGEAVGTERLQRALELELDGTTAAPAPSAAPASGPRLEVDPGGDAAELAVAMNALLDRQERTVLAARAAERRALFLARHDALTGLANRRALTEDVAPMLARRKPRTALVVACVDLDGFKAVNDGHGHAIGDRLLRAVAERLRGALRPDDRAFRTGGDEFVLVAPDAALETVGSEAREWAARLIEALSAPFEIDSLRLEVGASVGLAFAPEHAREADALVHLADLALCAAKAAGKRRAVVFEPSMGADARRRVELEAHLRSALGGGELSLQYQPQYDGAGTRLVGFEALLRWHSPALGRVGPDAFVPAAERLGIMDEIGTFALRTACAFAAGWPPPPGGDGGDGLSIAVNVSPSQLEHPRFVERIEAVLDDTGLAPDRLELEITEEVLVRDFGSARATLARLRKLGISIAVDDFGTGQTSLSYLNRLPISKLKIDRAFVAELEHDGRAREITRSIVRLGHRLGCRVVAEGVERRVQADILHAWDCDHVQGYLYARPLDPRDALGLIGAGVALERAA